MEIVSIFEEETKSKLWAVCYPEDEIDGESYDIFSKIFDLWENAEYLEDFFVSNKASLYDPFWEGLSIDAAIKKVRREAGHFEQELWNIVTNQPGYENTPLSSIFKPLHENIYSLNWDKEKHRKAKPDFSKPMLRIYGIELDDETLIVTGGGIKLTEKMDNELEEEKKQLIRVQNFLKSRGISDKQGLITE